MTAIGVKSDQFSLTFSCLNFAIHLLLIFPKKLLNFDSLYRLTVVWTRKTVLPPATLSACSSLSSSNKGCRGLSDSFLD
jgi:hypothetical protein